jgi:tRNA (guanosine-2'-O-)-methyltransferase
VLAHQRELGSRVLAVELAEGAVRLGDLPAARGRTVVLLGHERDGVPDEAMAMADAAVEIPMIGTGLSPNVAVAGSLVAYRLAGMV